MRIIGIVALMYCCFAIGVNAEEMAAVTNQPTMSREQALYVLEKVDPYSTNAMKALAWYMKQDYQKQRPALMRRLDEQLAQLDLELLGIRPHMGEPPRSGPWPESEFNALLKRQAEMKKAQQSLPPVSGTRVTPAAYAPVAPRIPER